MLQKEADQAKNYADKIEAELQTRERQLKKIQDKIDEDDKRLQDAQVNIEIVAEEKMEALAQAREIEQTNERLVGEIQILEERLREQEEVTMHVRREVSKEQKNTSDKITVILGLEDQIKQKEVEIGALQRTQGDLEAKIQMVDNRAQQTSKDLTELYQELS